MALSKSRKLLAKTLVRVLIFALVGFGGSLGLRSNCRYDLGDHEQITAHSKRYIKFSHYIFGALYA